MAQEMPTRDVARGLERMWSHKQLLSSEQPQCGALRPRGRRSQEGCSRRKPLQASTSTPSLTCHSSAPSLRSGPAGHWRLEPEDSPCAARKSSFHILPPLCTRSIASASTAASSPAAGAPIRRMKSSLSFGTFSPACSHGERFKAPTCEEDLWWKRGDEIGCGSYGSVHLARGREDGQIFAVKIARIRGDEDKKYAEQAQRELDICGDLNHRNVVRCLGSDSVNQKLYIYMEYMPGGTLRRHVGDFGALEGNLLGKAARGILKGLHYLHTHEPPIVHRDLKGANILLTLDFCVKLADFGCSKRGVDALSFQEVGSLHWMAPEVITKAGHGRMVDIWSFGCVLIEMAAASDPWGRHAFGSILDAAKIIGSSDRTPPVPESLSEASRNLLSRCLVRAPEKRASADELLKHEAVGRASRRVE